jgi:hypothetical protein
MYLEVTGIYHYAQPLVEMGAHELWAQTGLESDPPVLILTS